MGRWWGGRLESPRKAVADALHRYVLGIDTNNQDLFKSGYLKNESMAVIASPITIDGWTAISEFFLKVFVLVTAHVIRNIRIELKDGADTASMTTHALAYHVRPDDALKQEDSSYTASCLYFIDLVKDSNDGLWKIKKWEIKIQWTAGDRAVLHG
ncbi:hypothetical protein DL762_006067 [Monosporascus cannonballus]|uniref:SnoaL-like domain-containing protein n=1 Tax=Monosporascus cannonballus TaxID=155416 RepID=A0ABY0H325_9PEZI|nr:hypothetical protein DL762_006067 [Monosporascus cannonballus]